jgi:dipeptidase D
MCKEILYKSPILKNFYDICQIPHPSKKEELLIEYLINWAKERKLEYQKDTVGNILIKKDATKGKENSPMVVIQSHIDMVCEKYADLDFNFEKDSLKLRIENDWLKATGTTLGADDGIGAAAALAVLESDSIEHGPLECLFTVDEETGMTGVYGLQKDFLKGKYLLNLDSEDEGTIYIGCAGGQNTTLTGKQETTSLPEGHKTYELKIFGLNGGHSGIMIHKGLGNGIKILGRVLLDLFNSKLISLVNINGGDKHNAIPREVSAHLTCTTNQLEGVKKYLAEITAVLKAEFKGIEDQLALELKEIEAVKEVLSADFTEKLLNMLHIFPHGVMAMDRHNPTLVETSTNLASIIFKGDVIKMLTSQRSSIGSRIRETGEKVVSAGKLAGFSAFINDGYPAWEPNPDAELVKIVAAAYKQQSGEEAVVQPIHAGLECALIGEKYPELQMVSFGPTIEGAHTPEERMYLPSVANFWELLLSILKMI